MRMSNASMHTCRCLPCRPALHLRLAAAPACLPAAHRVLSLSAVRICCSSRLSLFLRHGPHILHCIACAWHCTMSVSCASRPWRLAHAWRAGCAGI